MTCIGSKKKGGDALTFVFLCCLRSKGTFSRGNANGQHTARTASATVATGATALLALADFLLYCWNQSLWDRLAAKHSAIKPAGLTDYRIPPAVPDNSSHIVSQ